MIVEPGRFNLESTAQGIIGINISDQFCHAITLERHVIDGLAEERIAFGIQRLNRHIHLLLVSQQEQVGGRG